MKRAECYYGVAGVNAHGVFDDYSKVLKAKRYIAKFKVKAFEDFDDACKWAEDEYYRMQTEYGALYYIDPICRLNWCYYRKRVDEM